VSQQVEPLKTLDSKLNQLRAIRRASGDGLQCLRPMGRTIFFDPELAR